MRGWRGSESTPTRVRDLLIPAAVTGGSVALAGHFGVIAAVQQWLASVPPVVWTVLSIAHLLLILVSAYAMMQLYRGRGGVAQ